MSSWRFESGGVAVEEPYEEVFEIRGASINRRGRLDRSTRKALGKALKYHHYRNGSPHVNLHFSGEGDWEGALEKTVESSRGSLKKLAEKYELNILDGEWF